MFAGAIEGGERRAIDRCRRGGIHDRPPARLQHLPDLVFHAQPYAPQIDVHHLLEGLVFLFVNLPQGLEHARVVQADVKAAKSLDGGLHHSLDLRLDGDIDVERNRFAAFRGDHPQGLRVALLLEIGQRDLCPFAGEANCRCPANPPARSRDDHGLPFETSHEFPSLFLFPWVFPSRQSV